MDQDANVLQKELLSPVCVYRDPLSKTELLGSVATRKQASIIEGRGYGYSDNKVTERKVSPLVCETLRSLNINIYYRKRL